MFPLVSFPCLPWSHSHVSPSLIPMSPLVSFPCFMLSCSQVDLISFLCFPWSHSHVSPSLIPMSPLVSFPCLPWSHSHVSPGLIPMSPLGLFPCFMVILFPGWPGLIPMFHIILFPGGSQVDWSHSHVYLVLFPRYSGILEKLPEHLPVFKTAAMGKRQENLEIRVRESGNETIFHSDILFKISVFFVPCRGTGVGVHPRGGRGCVPSGPVPRQAPYLCQQRGTSCIQFVSFIWSNIHSK